MSPPSRRELRYPSSTPFIGREPELRALRGCLERAQSGHGTVVLVAGEPGIGKTRLAEVFSAQAQAVGMRVLWGRCYEWEGAPAYWPWLQLLRGYIDAIDDCRLRAEFGTRAPDVAQVFPELRQRFSDIPYPPPVEPAQARFQLFEALTSFIRSAARAQPLMVVLEDLHWADAPSLLLLQFLTQGARDVPVLLLATFRDAEVDRQHPLSSTLISLARETHTERLFLRGLSRSEVRTFVEHVSGVSAGNALVSALHSETDGNPFFVGEITRLLASEGRLAQPLQTPLRNIPESVRGVIDRRLDRLPEACRQMLVVASVIGREFRLPLLQRASAVARDELLQVLGAALDARLINEEPDGWYRFSHALVQETLYSSLALVERARLHLSIAEALEASIESPMRSRETGLGSLDLASRDATLAYHFGAAAPLGFARQSLDYALKAARRAMEQAAWESAVGSYQHMLGMFELMERPDPVFYCETLLGLGEAQNHAAAGRGRMAVALGAGGSPDGFQTFRRAARVAEEADLAEQMARAVLGMSGFNPHAHQAGVEGPELMDRALQLLPASDSALRARLLARVSTDRYLLLEFAKLPYSEALGEQIRAQSDEAVAMARRLNDSSTLAYALIMRHLQGEFYGLEERIVSADEIVALVEPESSAMVWGLQQKLIALDRLGRVSEAQVAFARVEQVVERLHIPYFDWRLATHRAVYALRAGDFAGAEAWLGRAAEIQPNAGVNRMTLWVIRREQGRVDELEGLSIQGGIPNSHAVRAVSLLTLLETGRLDAGRRQFELLIAERLDNPTVPLRVLSIFAEACVALGDTARAPAIYARLLPFAGRNVVSASTDYVGGAAAHYLGILAAMLARPDDAERHFANALEADERWGYPLYAAYDRYAWAEMLARRGRAADRERITMLLTDALAAARDVGSVRLARLVEPLGRQLGINLPAAQPEAVNPVEQPLSPREREVLAHIVSGRTDKEIAALLYISPRTVTTHVTNILNKLGVNSRVEAASLVTQKGHGSH